MKIFGILNITADSFSDGGKFLDAGSAIAHAQALAAEGADVIDIGAASSNPRAAAVPAETEIARLAAVLPALKAKGLKLSIDSFSPSVQRWALAQGIDWLNDIHGFPDDALYPALAKSDCGLVVMHMVQEEGVAVGMDVPAAEIMARITRFFDHRIGALTAAGIARERLVLDPGMGFFLGRAAENSFEVLRRLPELRQRYGLPLLISVSRKSFLRGGLPPQAPEVLGASLAAELAAGAGGADLIRTHMPGPLRAALKTLKAIGKSDLPALSGVTGADP
jgi:dihydropteroate synthase type 2